MRTVPIGRRAALGLLAAPALVRAGRAATQLVLASGYPDGNFHTRTIRFFAERAKALSGG